MSTQKPFTRTVVEIGGSLYVSLPRGAADRRGVSKGDELPMDLDAEADKVSYKLD